MAVLTTMHAAGKSWPMMLPDSKLGRQARGGRPYEPKLLNDIRREGFTGAAFDIGAYWGNHALYMAVVCKLVVHAFEPDPDRLELLRHNVEINRAAIVRVHPWAVGRGDGEAEPVRGHRAAKLQPGTGGIEVHAIDTEMDVPALSVVKLDIEGMEAQALEGMSKHLERYKPVVYSETHDDGKDQTAILTSLGYELDAKLRVPSPMWKWRA